MFKRGNGLLIKINNLTTAILATKKNQWDFLREFIVYKMVIDGTELSLAFGSLSEWENAEFSSRLPSHLQLIPSKLFSYSTFSVGLFF